MPGSMSATIGSGDERVKFHCSWHYVCDTQAYHKSDTGEAASDLFRQWLKRQKLLEAGQDTCWSRRTPAQLWDAVSGLADPWAAFTHKPHWSDR